MQIQIFGDSVQARLKHWREEIAKVSQAQLCELVNRHLPKGKGVVVSTVSNYERTTEPRASFLAALKHAYPELNLDWLVSGEGKLVAAEQEIAEVLRTLQSEGRSALGQLVQQPGLQRFRTLPEPAAHVVLAFLQEVKLSTPEYRKENQRPWREFLQRFTPIFFEPLQAPRNFATKEALSEHETTTYAVSLVATLRPLVPSFRSHDPMRVASPAPLERSPSAG